MFQKQAALLKSLQGLSAFFHVWNFQHSCLYYFPPSFQEFYVPLLTGGFVQFLCYVNSRMIARRFFWDIFFLHAWSFRLLFSLHKWLNKQVLLYVATYLFLLLDWNILLHFIQILHHCPLGFLPKIPSASIRYLSLSAWCTQIPEPSQFPSLLYLLLITAALLLPI